VRDVTLRVLCEGPTEQNFCTQVLAPHLRSVRVFIRPEPLCQGRFGIVPFAKLRRAIKGDIGRSRSHEWVTTMIDLYGLVGFPGAEMLPPESVNDRVARIEAEMAEGLPNPRFIPYIQVHEFEALVLVDVDLLPSQFPDGEADGAPARLRARIGNTAPEEVNDGDETAPSKRLIREVPGYAAMKSIAGPSIVSRIGLPRLRQTCPHFGAWVDQLERLSAEP